MYCLLLCVLKTCKILCTLQFKFNSKPLFSLKPKERLSEVNSNSIEDEIIFMNARLILHLDIPSYYHIVWVEIIECASNVQQVQ